MEATRLLPTIGELLAHHQPVSLSPGECPSPKPGNRERAEREWTGAIAALEHLLVQTTLNQQPTTIREQDYPQGLVLSGPLPVLSHPLVMTQLPTWIFTLEPGMPCQLPPSKGFLPQADLHPAHVLSLLPTDPLTAERFCLVLTTDFSLVLVLGCGSDRFYGAGFQFSFDPQVVEQSWQLLRLRVQLTRPLLIPQLDCLVSQFPPVAPDYQMVTQFSRLLLQYLPEPVPLSARRSLPKKLPAKWKTPRSDKPLCSAAAPDVELLQALAHEIRTPLATIRTLTRLLLKRQGLAPEVISQLEGIDRECTEQIDRFNLIFRAVELETATAVSAPMPLTPVSVSEVLHHSVPRWQQQARRRHLTLDVQLPQQIPTIVSDPAMLDQALTGLIEQFTRNLPAGSQIQVQVLLAGNQLKLQLRCQSEDDTPLTPGLEKPMTRDIGHLLTFQPETGNLSLKLAVTKNLFQALGGKLTVRQHPHQGDVLTVYLPFRS